ncbi:TRAP transporter small permease [Ammoniphilus sp. 3BR4]|uniref:TRAP transporter small permease n=1 Tax=Ammoniphilus sp. 3BR4 TaxID=3158265 RepID=UPI00346691EE
MMISNFITKFTQLNKWLAFSSLIIMMVFVFICATARGLGFPIVGDIELVQLAMVSLIVGALAYTDSEKGHISIGIIVDHFPLKLQYLIDFVAAILKTGFAFLVAYVFLTKMDFNQTSILLKVPFFFFEILLIIGFVGWGLESIRQIFQNIFLLLGRSTVDPRNEEEVKVEKMAMIE